MKEYSKLLSLVHEKNPLICQITNSVTIESCANITICIGASPVMSNSSEDAADMVKMSDALLLNIGTIDEKQTEIMLAAGNEAAKQNIPIILDPVGAGATKYRTQTAERFMNELPIAVLKGNAGEIGTLAGESAEVKGVDSISLKRCPADTAKDFAKSCGSVIIISGAEDIISDGLHTYGVLNGDKIMGKISGTGCMAGSVCSAFAAVSDNLTKGCVSAMTYLGIAGEAAAQNSNGPGTFRAAFFDAVYNLSQEQFIKSAKIKEYE